MRTLLPVHYYKAEGELIVYLPLQLSGLCFVTQRVPARPTRPTAATGRPALPLSSPLPPARRLGHPPLPCCTCAAMAPAAHRSHPTSSARAARLQPRRPATSAIPGSSRHRHSTSLVTPVAQAACLNLSSAPVASPC